MIQAIIFDKDGTLHDTEKVFEQAWTIAAAEFDVPDIAATLRDCTGMTIPAIGAYWEKKYPTIPFDAYIARRQYHFGRMGRSLAGSTLPFSPRTDSSALTLTIRPTRRQLSGS